MPKRADENDDIYIFLLGDISSMGYSQPMAIVRWTIWTWQQLFDVCGPSLANQPILSDLPATPAAAYWSYLIIRPEMLCIMLMLSQHVDSLNVESWCLKRQSQKV